MQLSSPHMQNMACRVELTLWAWRTLLTSIFLIRCRTTRIALDAPLVRVSSDLRRGCISQKLGKAGLSLSLVSPEEAELFEEVKANQRVHVCLAEASQSIDLFVGLRGEAVHFQDLSGEWLSLSSGAGAGRCTPA